MLISEELNEAFNGQIGNEFGASLQYVEIASYFENDDLPVLARHFFQQSNEERDHAMRLVRFVLDAGGKVRIPSIPAPRAEFASAEEAVGLALEWENTVTDQIDGLMDLAIKENNHIARNILEWFVSEQLEEVSSTETLLGMVRRAGESGLLLVESHLARDSGSLTAGSTESTE